jgi:hypothetical protein
MVSRIKATDTIIITKVKNHGIQLMKAVVRLKDKATLVLISIALLTVMHLVKQKAALFVEREGVLEK